MSLRVVFRTLSYRGASARLALLFFLVCASAVAVKAEISETMVDFGAFGRPGLIDMPSGDAATDGTLGLSYSYSKGFTRNAVFFQFAPWGSVTLRYGGNGAANGQRIRPNYDRSLDLVLSPVNESRFVPAVSFGLQDLMGTGAYSGEFVALSKSFAKGHIVTTAGLGWGRLASRGGFENPLGAVSSSFDLRPDHDWGRGGKLSVNQWFRGNAALFAGIHYRVNDRITVSAEYSTDNYTQFRPVGTLTARSPMNYGISYHLNQNINAFAGYLQGDAVILGLSFRQNLNESKIAGSKERAPSYVVPRQSAAAPVLMLEADIREKVRTIFNEVGLQLHSIEVQDKVIRVGFENLAYDFEAQALGRAAKWLTHVVPTHVEEFQLTLLVSGMPTATLLINRDELEANEHKLYGTERLLQLSQLIRADANFFHRSDYLSPIRKFEWGIGPYAEVTLFDPDKPRRADTGLQVSSKLRFGDRFFVSANLKKRIYGNRAAGRTSNSALPHVRSDQVLYDQSDDLRIDSLYFSSYQKIASDLYGRLTIGYLEQMYAGLSAEVLWKPFHKNWTLGAELNHVTQRDYDGRLGFRDYSVMTGHLSGEYSLENGYFGRIDAGRYLAGDTGATFSVGREFNNGWRLSAHTTFTNVSFADFGEGSFDKGIRIEIPVSQIIGTATRYTYDININSINRDGGRRVNIPGRLSQTLRGYNENEIEKSWSRFLR